MLSREGEPQIEVGAGSSSSTDSRDAGRKAARAALAWVKKQPLALVLVFASVRHDLEALLDSIVREVGAAPLVGATTAGEICGGLAHGTVSVLVVASRHLNVRVGLGERISEDRQRAVDNALRGLDIPDVGETDSAYWRELKRGGKSAFGLLFSPGNTRGAVSLSYEILEQIKARTRGRIPIAGGSAADDWRMEQNFVFWGRRAVPDALIFAVCETRLRVGMGVAHGFRPSQRRAVVTRVRGHEVLELDDQPAIETYARLLDCEPNDLEGKHVTLESGRPAGVAYRFGQYGINVASFVTAERGLSFTQPMEEGATLTMMEGPPERLVRAGADALHKALLRGAIVEPAAVVVFSCALRAKILQERSVEEIRRIEAILPGVPLVGFSSFGEQGVTDDGANEHNNAIVSVLVVGKQLTQAAEVALENERLAAESSSDRERLRLALDGANLGMWDVRLGSGEVAHDHRLGQIRGLDGDDLSGTRVRWRELVHPDDMQRLKDAMERHLSGEAEVFEVEHRLQHRDGHWLWVLTRGRVVERDEKGRATHVAGTSLDITQRIRAEQELRELVQTQAVLVREANHRVKNNLSAVLGMLHLEQSRDLPPAERGDGDLARRLTSRIEGLSAVHSLLSSLGWKAPPLPKLCERVIYAGLKGMDRDVRVQVVESDIRVDSNVAHQLALLLIELVTNSAKHAFPHVDSPRISIAAQREGDDVLLVYRDNGPGHPPDLLAGLREARSIGVEIVEGITHMLRGTVVFENDEGAVTRLRFPHPEAGEETS